MNRNNSGFATFYTLLGEAFQASPLRTSYGLSSMRETQNFLRQDTDERVDVYGLYFDGASVGEIITTMELAVAFKTANGFSPAQWFASIEEGVAAGNSPLVEDEPSKPLAISDDDDDDTTDVVEVPEDEYDTDELEQFILNGGHDLVGSLYYSMNLHRWYAMTSSKFGTPRSITGVTMNELLTKILNFWVEASEVEDHPATYHAIIDLAGEVALITAQTNS